MAATILSVNEKAGAQLSNIDTEGEPIALSAPESHIYAMPDGTKVTIAASPIYTPMFRTYCAMMRRSDLLKEPRFATAHLRRQNLPELLALVRNWILSFSDLDELQAQVSEANLAIGVVRTTNELAATQWAKEWGAVVEVDDRAGGVVRMPGPPWKFSESELPPPGIPSFQGEDNVSILTERKVDPTLIEQLKERRVLLSRRAFRGAYD
jgi:crotonobetainyl-CoA:carnitine CoA-transferase CaiB-like acyl-CoA transferase